MTVMPRISSKKAKSRRSSFVASGRGQSVVPDALSWRDRLDGSAAPKGPAAWAAASSMESGRTVVDAGPYGVIDLAAVDAAPEFRGPDQNLGVVWWDKRSYREEDHDEGTIQTSFVPASISDHVSLARPGATRPAEQRETPRPSAQAPTGGRSFLETIHGDGRPVPPRTAPAHGPADPKTPRKARRSEAGSLHSPGSGVTGPAPQASSTGAPFSDALSGTMVVPLSASRTLEAHESQNRGHARRSRHVALVPRGRGQRGAAASSHPRRARLRRRRSRRRMVLGAALVIVAFVVTVLVQTALITPFTVPSESMEGTLGVGDRIMINKAAYAFSEIHRGDVVVFTDPGGWLAGSGTAAAAEDGFLVKRVIGIPGDHVSCCGANGKVTVNGLEVVEPHAVVPDGSESAAPFDVTVPSGALWVLGDNRSKSRDSSQTQQLPSKGFVPIANVVGQAVLKVWPLDRLSIIDSAQDAFAGIPDQTCPI